MIGEDVCNYIEELIVRTNIKNLSHKIDISRYDFRFLKGMNGLVYRVFITSFEGKTYLFIRVFTISGRGYKDYLFEWGSYNIEDFMSMARTFEFRYEENLGCCLARPDRFSKEDAFRLIDVVLKTLCSRRSYIKSLYGLK